MQNTSQNSRPVTRFGGKALACAAWALLGLASLYPVVRLLNASFPVFTVIWLVVPLGVVLRTKDAARVGFAPVSGRSLLANTLLFLGGVLALMLAFEPWSHTYQTLVRLAMSPDTPDPTFGWILRLPGWEGWLGMAAFSGLVTLFGEELFFRGWLLQGLQKRMKPFWAVFIQALLFSAPQALAAWMLPPLQGVLYAFIYSFLAIGLVGGWVALRTQSIWPSLIGASLVNLALTAFVLLRGA